MFFAVPIKHTDADCIELNHCFCRATKSNVGLVGLGDRIIAFIPQFPSPTDTLAGSGVPQLAASNSPLRWERVALQVGTRILARAVATL